MAWLRVAKYPVQPVHSVIEELTADHMGFNETDEKVMKKRTLGAFYLVFVEKLYRGLVHRVWEMCSEPLMLGSLFAMDSLKSNFKWSSALGFTITRWDISPWKMMESLNMDKMGEFFLNKKRYRAERLWMKAKILSIVTFENWRKKKDGIS